VEFFKAEVSADGKLKTTTHGLKSESRQEFSAADIDSALGSIVDIGSKLRTNEREQAAKAGPIIALAKKIYNQDSPGVITPDEFLNIYKAFQALGPAEVPNTPVPPVTEPRMTTLPPLPPRFKVEEVTENAAPNAPKTNAGPPKGKGH
jgi:hypothetical protein